MAYFSVSAECFICSKNLGLATGRGRWELSDGKWICVECAKKYGINSIKVKSLTSQKVQQIMSGELIFGEEDEVHDPNIIYSLKGNRGRKIRVYEDKCTIFVKPNMGSFVSGNVSDGEKTIYYTDVIGIQFKRSGIQIGYLQLETASSLMNKRENNFFNENSFTFDKTIISNERMEEVKEYIEERIKVYKKGFINTQPSVSSADEILKYKKLFDDGIITKEEFDAKKKQLLDL